MKITEKLLDKWNVCDSGRGWLLSQKERDGAAVVEKLIKENRLDWANWTIARILDKKQRIRYAIFAAEQVIEIFEKKYPEDKRPREAIEAAKRYLNKPTKANKDAAAYAAAYAADHAADVAARAAAYAARAAAYAARAADAAADVAAYAAAYAADVAADAAAYAMKIKIIEYGISLLRKEDL